MGALRHEDWPTRLAEYLAERQAMPFEWGAAANDCCSFTMLGVERLTGWNPMADYRYRTKQGAMRALARNGGLEAAVESALEGCPEIAPLCAQRGDVVLFDAGELTVGLCVGSQIAAPGERGLTRMPLSTAIRAWRI